jgi:hypothetical protein
MFQRRAVTSRRRQIQRSQQKESPEGKTQPIPMLPIAVIGSTRISQNDLNILGTAIAEVLARRAQRQKQ